MGGTGLESFITPVRNNYDNASIAGGSSSGSAVQVSSGIVPFSIGTDTGDSIRRPASLTGVCGFKPTYGLISRYGCIPYAPSMDTLGVLAASVADCAIVCETIVQHDQRDYTSQRIIDNNFFKNIKVLEKINFVIIEGIEEYLEGHAKTIYLDTLSKIRQTHNIINTTVKKEILEAISPTYMTLTYAEACSCHANKTGIPFGLCEQAKGFEETLTKNRTAGFGKQVKRRMIIGSFITKSENFEAIYQRTKKIRTLLINELNNILAKGDCLLLPGASSFAPKIDAVINKTFKTTLADDALELANFAGTPSITIPVKTDSMPFGINITCPQFADQKVLDIALTLEEVVNV
jgi:aspartyl-tRNA(Asn)/glutamyl-tRNA(Gln) amidotransferase subunit A